MTQQYRCTHPPERDCCKTSWWAEPELLHTAPWSPSTLGHSKRWKQGGAPLARGARRPGEQRQRVRRTLEAGSHA